jgi:DNA-binding response OmpR family regulator
MIILYDGGQKARRTRERRGRPVNILVCDDDREIVAAIEIYLKSEGYEVFPAYDGQEALRILAEREIHLALLDVMMPNLNGMLTTRKIRETQNIPIIMLSAKSEDYDKITGLNAGADDYMTKPFHPLELIARVRSQLRRYLELGSAKKELTSQAGIYQTGGLVVDDGQKTVFVDGEQVPVTPIEFGIVRFLTANAGRVYSIDQIYEAVWGETAYNAGNTVSVHIRRIREKIEINPKEPKYLKVVWGIGYKMEKR